MCVCVCGRPEEAAFQIIWVCERRGGPGNDWNVARLTICLFWLAAVSNWTSQRQFFASTPSLGGIG